MMPDLRRTPASDSAATSVYRYYDRHGVLIYVGITKRGITRNFEHNGSAPWWPYVAHQDVEHYPTRTEAERRERALIVEFRPPFNTQHNPGSAELRREYLAWEASESPDRDPVEMANAIGRRLPMTALGIGEDDRFVLRTTLEHAAVVRRVSGSVGVPVLSPRLIGRVSDVHQRGSHAVLLVRLKGGLLLGGLPPLDTAIGLAPIRFASTKPVAFRIPQVDLYFLGTRTNAARAISPAPGGAR
jgi:hypothetical protein